MKLGTWRTGTQWVSGIMLVNFLAVALLVNGLSRVVSPVPAKTVIVPAVKQALIDTQFVPNYDKMRPSLQSLAPDDPLKVPGLPNLGFQAKDVSGLGGEKVAALVADRVAVKIYHGDLVVGQVGSERLESLDGPMAFLTRATYTAVKEVGIILWVLAAIAGASVFLFGKGLRRVSGLGLAVAIGSLPPWLAYTAALTMAATARPSSVVEPGLNPWVVAKPLVPAIVASRSFAATILLGGAALLGVVFAGTRAYRALRRAAAPGSGLGKPA